MKKKKTDDHSNEEKVANSEHEKGDKHTEEDPTLSNSEQQDVNEWFV